MASIFADGQALAELDGRAPVAHGLSGCFDAHDGMTDYLNSDDVREGVSLSDHASVLLFIWRFVWGAV